MLVDIHTVNMASMHTCSSTNVTFSEYHAGLTSSAKPKHQVDAKDLKFYSDSYDEHRKFKKDAADKLKMIEKK